MKRVLISWLLLFEYTQGQVPCTQSALLESFGAGSAGSLGVPQLTNQGVPLVGLPFALAIEKGLPGATGIAVLSTLEGLLPLPAFAATLYLDLSAPLLTQGLTVGSAGTVPDLFAVQSLPLNACGAQLAAQAWIIDPLAFGGLAFTPGYRVRFGAAPTGPLLPGAHVQAGNEFVIGSAFVGGASADLDGDGRDDLVTLDQSPPRLLVRLGLGDIEFGPIRSFPLPQIGRQLELVDLDLDGSLDAAVVLLGSGSGTPSLGVALLRGDGAGGFLAPQVLPVGGGPVSLDSGDIDLDGLPDLALARSQSGEAVILRNLGGASFAAPLVVSLGTELTGLTLGDLDGNGRLDLVGSGTIAAEARVMVSLQAASGQFGPVIKTPLLNFPSAAPLLSDFNSDGRLDMALHEGAFGVVRVRLGDGFGGFQAPKDLPPGAGVFAAQLADLDLDGRQDLVMSRVVNFASTGDVRLLRSLGDGSFAELEPIPLGLSVTRCIVGRFGPDAWPDILVASQDDTAALRAFPGRGAGQFSAPKLVGTVRNTKDIKVADLDDDGQPDLVILDRGEQALPEFPAKISIATAASGYALSSQPVISLPGNPVPAMALGDFDADGRQDIAVVGGGFLRILRGLAGAAFSLGQTQPLTKPTWAVRTGDVDQDGDLDLVMLQDVICCPSERTIQIFFGDGSGGFQPGDTELARSVLDIAVADLAGDDRPELIAAVTFPSKLSILQFGPGGSLNVTLDLPLSIQPRSVQLDDADNDGDLDLLALHYQEQGSISLIENLGAGTFSAPLNYALGSYTAQARLVDMDQDGLRDLLSLDSASLAPNPNLGRITLRLGLAGGGFAAAQTFGTGLDPIVLEIEDLDGDTLPDLVVGSRLSRQVWSLSNLLLR